MNIYSLVAIWFVFAVALLLFACGNQGVFQVQSLPNPRERISANENPCRLTEKLPDDFSLFAAGAYSGRKLDYQIDSSGHQATQIDVVVNHFLKPVVLMLGAYEPTIWNISWTSETKIIAVFLSGHHKPVVCGTEESTLLKVSTNENKGKCGTFYVDPHRLRLLNPIARRVFEREVDMVFFAKNGQVLIGEALPEKTKLIQSPLTKPEQYRKKELSGISGLEQAVLKGELRKATLNDAYAWVDVISKESPPKDIPPVSGQSTMKIRRPLLLNAYVVLKPFTYPSGLFGGNSATFFIPKGVPKPNGNPGHSTVYDFNTLSCVGSLCRQGY